MFKLVLKDDWSVLGSNQGRSFLLKGFTPSLALGTLEGARQRRDVVLGLGGGGQLRVVVFLGGFRASPRWFLYPPWCKSGVAGQENDIFSFCWQLKREN